MHPRLRVFSCALALVASCAASLAAQAEPLKVGATATGVPFTFLDVKTNSIQGMMVDSAQAVAKAGGFDVEIAQTTFAALIPSLTAKKIDLISAAMLRTPEREKVVQYSDPVFEYGEGLVVRADDDKAYTSMDDFKGEIVGAQVGTIFIDKLNQRGIFKEVRGYDSLADLTRDLALGRIKAGFGDHPILAYQMAKGTLKKVRLVDSYQPQIKGEVCLILRRGDPALLAQVNKGIASIKADGTLAGIIGKWHLD
ncbi:ABC transporter substrate-binding protein [Pseudomonas sp. GD04087]|uniref:ABC transporter substrate-binding protein n=1 Tax=unclassified Pseudomonas TaxID=196821 RepID=UPI00244C723D|nr:MULTISPECIES: ABC transporter substrate-binding protein [unclassified Pseudomonas]MDH0291869.1 ABC transporter substrate-binding protein [Pseudomonas sp. GD04087]MDH1050063.1 ABC transporter substrate-binding protein [Pseudomonas sp. GD03903]MDH2003172.1 ABC transporter substrate-binding protein [Pseudomonas sp. GD03691]